MKRRTGAAQARGRQAAAPRGRILRVPRGIPGGLQASQYAALLADPCTQPLVHPVGPGNGGFLVRVESDYIIGNGATATAGFLRWAPGALVKGTTGDAGLAYATGTTDLATLTAIGTSADTYLPAYTYLTTNARSQRCVAACIQLMWPGTELNRQGIVSGTVAPMETIIQGDSVTVANIRAGSGFTQRMPTEKMEIKWSPAPADLLYENLEGNIASQSGHNALIVTWAGIPVSTGVRLRLVAVYEWLPRTVNGFVTTADAGTGGSASHITANDVLTGMRRSMGEWRFPRVSPNVASAAAQFANMAISGVVGYAASRRRAMVLG